MAAAGVYLAFTKSQPGDVLGGTLTLYLVATGWVSVRRADADRRTFDWIALAVVVTLAAVTLTWGIEAARSCNEFYGPEKRVSAWGLRVSWLNCFAVD